MRRYDQYRVKRGDNLAEPQFWNKILEDLDLRLAAREVDGAAIANAQDQMIAVALTRLNDTFTPLLVEAQNRLNALGVSFSAESLTEETIAASGDKQFTLTEATAENYVYSDYVSIRAASASENRMLAQVTSFDRPSRVLSVTVVSGDGSGTFSNWLFRVGTPPETGHAARTDNPHETTAAQVGAYTAAATDAAIEAAIALIPGVDLSSRLAIAQNLADLTDKPAARTNLQLGALAVLSSVGSGEIAANMWATLAQAQAGTNSVAFMTALRVFDAITARIATQAQAEAGADNAQIMTALRVAQAMTAVAVKLTGNQTIAGIKTFSSIPVGPASNPTTDNQLSRKAYVDGLASWAYGRGTEGVNAAATAQSSIAGLQTQIDNLAAALQVEVERLNLHLQAT